MFNDRSQDRLQGVDPRLVQILQEVRRRSGVNFEITEGLRSRERQAELVSAGKSQTQNSYHLGGGAVDIHILNPDGSANWDFDAYRPLGDLAKAVASEYGYDDLVWGGDWESLRDGVHFQLGGSPPQAAGPLMASNSTTQPQNALATPQMQPQDRMNALRAQIPEFRNSLDVRNFLT